MTRSRVEDKMEGSPVHHEPKVSRETNEGVGVGIILITRPVTREYCASSWHTKGAGTKSMAVWNLQGEVWPRGIFIEFGIELLNKRGIGFLSRNSCE